jgi:hypothetical protein
MSKVMNVPNYRHATHKALSQIVTAKGSHVNWSIYAADFKISKNYGTVLSRIGVIQRVKGGFYKSNINGYASKTKAQLIVDVIRRHNLINEPNNASSLKMAKIQLENMGVIRAPKDSKAQPAPATVSKKNPTMKVVTLDKLPTDVLLNELRRRLQ